MLRVVLDTNVLISGLLQTDGAPGKVLNALLAGRFEAVVTRPLVDELLTVIGRPKFARFRFDRGTVTAIEEAIWQGLPEVVIEVGVRDASDRIVISAAVAGRAHAIVTGDHGFLDDADLLDWLQERGIEVLTPAQMLSRITPPSEVG